MEDAVFYYKGFQFNYHGDFFGDMVEKKGLKTLYKVNPDLFWFGVRDESYGGSWICGIKDDGEIVFEESHLLDVFWE